MNPEKILDELTEKDRKNGPKGIPRAKWCKHMSYTGPESHFWGHTALVRDDPKDKNYVLAQFDDMSLRYKGVYMGYAWVSFPRHHWKIEK